MGPPCFMLRSRCGIVCDDMVAYALSGRRKRPSFHPGKVNGSDECRIFVGDGKHHDPLILHSWDAGKNGYTKVQRYILEGGVAFPDLKHHIGCETVFCIDPVQLRTQIAGLVQHNNGLPCEILKCDGFTLCQWMVFWYSQVEWLAHNHDGLQFLVLVQTEGKVQFSLLQHLKQIEGCSLCKLKADVLILILSVNIQHDGGDQRSGD